MQTLESEFPADPRSYTSGFEQSSSRLSTEDDGFPEDDVFSKNVPQPAPPTEARTDGATNPNLIHVGGSSSSSGGQARGQVGSSAMTSSSAVPSSSSSSSAPEGPPAPSSAEPSSSGIKFQSFQELKPTSKRKRPSFRLFTRKGVEYILRTPLRRGLPKPTEGEFPPAKKPRAGQRGAMWVEDVVSVLQRKADETANELVVVEADAITKTVVREIRNKLMIDEEGVIRTKRAFHFNAKVEGSVLLWPEEVTVMMRHKFIEFGSLDDIEGFFELFWSWYQPKYPTKELEFRRNLTKYVYEYDEVVRLGNEEELLAQQLLEVRKSRLAKLGEIQQSLKSSPLGGELQCLATMRDKLHKHLQGAADQ